MPVEVKRPALYQFECLMYLLRAIASSLSYGVPGSGLLPLGASLLLSRCSSLPLPFWLEVVPKKNRPPRLRGSRLRHWLHPLQAPRVRTGFLASTVCGRRSAGLVTKIIWPWNNGYVCRSAYFGLLSYADRHTTNGLVGRRRLRDRSAGGYGTRTYIRRVERV